MPKVVKKKARDFYQPLSSSMSEFEVELLCSELNIFKNGTSIKIFGAPTKTGSVVVQILQKEENVFSTYIVFPILFTNSFIAEDLKGDNSDKGFIPFGATIDLPFLPKIKQILAHRGYFLLLLEENRNLFSIDLAKLEKHQVMKMRNILISILEENIVTTVAFSINDFVQVNENFIFVGFNKLIPYMEGQTWPHALINPPFQLKKLSGRILKQSSSSDFKDWVDIYNQNSLSIIVSQHLQALIITAVSIATFPYTPERIGFKKTILCGICWIPICVADKWKLFHEHLCMCLGDISKQDNKESILKTVIQCLKHINDLIYAEYTDYKELFHKNTDSELF